MIELNVNSSVKICISEPNELLELMTGDDKVQLIESLSCHDEVVTHVVNQIKHIHGCTENGHSGWSSGITGSTPIDKARMEIAKSASELAADTIAKLERDLKYQEGRTSEWCNKYHNLRDGG